MEYRPLHVHTTTAREEEYAEWTSARTSSAGLFHLKERQRHDVPGEQSGASRAQILLVELKPGGGNARQTSVLARHSR